MQQISPTSREGDGTATHTPVLTTLIPVRDRVHLVRGAVESVLAQTCDDLEVVVIDDGSTDGSAAAVQAIDDARVRIVRQPPRGIGAALNRGLAIAAGQYVARLDSDDLWEPRFAERMLAVLGADSRLVLAYARAQAMTSAGAAHPASLGVAPRWSDDLLASVLYTDCMCSIASVIRRDVLLDLGGWNETLLANEDWDLSLRLAQRGPVAFIDATLAHYRLHDGRLTSPTSPAFERVLHERRTVLDTFFASPDLSPHVRALAPTAYRNLATEAALQLAAVGRWREAAHRLGVALAGPAPNKPPAVHAAAFTLARFLWFLVMKDWLGHTAAGRMVFERASGAWRRARRHRIGAALNALRDRRDSC